MHTLGKWWKKQGVGIRAAIISGAFLLVATLCTNLFEVPRLVGEIGGLMDRSMAPDPQLEAIHFEPYDDLISGRFGAQDIEIVFDKCWQTESGRRIEKKEEVSIAVSLLMTAPKHVIVKEISVTLDDFQPAPDLSVIETVVMAPEGGGGGGPVTKYLLGTHELVAPAGQRSLSEGTVFEVDHDKPLSFGANILLSPTGISTFHVEAVFGEQRGKDGVVKSESFTYGGITIDDPSLLLFEDKGTGMVFVDCDEFAAVK